MGKIFEIEKINRQIDKYVAALEFLNININIFSDISKTLTVV